LQVDHRLLEHALANLLFNAAAHSPVGAPISVTALVEGEHLLLKVADRGTGIPPEALPHVFERFYRAPGERKAGTGLGLSIVQAIVRAHGGEVSAANHPEGGALFTLSLPIPPAPELPAVPGGE
jgi:two-component system sensor histidine kinase MtrB